MELVQPNINIVCIHVCLLAILLVSGCKRGLSDVEERMFQQLKTQNYTLNQLLHEGIADARHKLQSLEVTGNFKYSYIKVQLEEIASGLELEWQRLNRLELMDAEEPAVVDSVLSLVRSWDAVRGRLCSSFSSKNLAVKPWPCDTSENKLSEKAHERFSVKHEPYWDIELEMIESQLLQEAIEFTNFLRQSINIGSFRIDSLVLLNYPLENAVMAGEEAQIGLTVILSGLGISPEFEGDGRIVTNKGGNAAILYIPTSENMIPAGKDEAIIPYSAKAIAPQSDGELQTLRTSGKIKIRRPCKTDGLNQ